MIIKNYKALKFSAFNREIIPFTNPMYWIIIHDELLSPYLTNLIIDLKKILPLFSNEDINQVNEFNYSPLLLRNICINLSDKMDIIIALKASNGWKDELGLELAKFDALQYQKEKDRIPISNDLNSISRAIIKGRWRKYGINSWNDFLNQVFGETNIKDHGYYRGKQGLKNAEKEAKEFENKIGRLPIVTDLITIKTKITEGYWREFGINKWNDFLKLVFNKINVDRTIDYTLYEGKSGIKAAQFEVAKFLRNNDNKPRIVDLKHIKRVIDNGTWVKYGISTWNDFLKKTTGDINVQHNKYTHYKGKEGLNTAKKHSKSFFQIESRLPKRRDCRAINQVIMNGYWEEFGIRTFNDFLKYVFGKINMKANGWYKGELGLSRALTEGINFYKKTGKIPVKRDLRTIYSLITDRGYWKEFGIDNWGDYKSKFILSLDIR